MFFVLVDNPFFDQMKKSYNEGAVRQEIEKQQFPTLKEMNFIEELEWVSKIIVKANSPVVFSHNDFGRKNILVKESTDSSDKQIFLIDFDWTNYNSRGVDFGQYFSSWAQNEPDFGSGDFPSDEEMAPLIDAYIEGMSEILGTSFAKQEINSRQQIIKEAKIYTLMAFMKDVMYCIWQTDLMNKEFLVSFIWYLFENKLILFVL